jgi:hypothetical protein
MVSKLNGIDPLRIRQSNCKNEVAEVRYLRFVSSQTNLVFERCRTEPEIINAAKGLVIL